MLCPIQFEKINPAEVLAFARLGAPPVQRRCPFCDSIVYSRRHKLCGVCAGELPAECLFTPDQARGVEEIVREERMRHRAWLMRANSEN